MVNVVNLFLFVDFMIFFFGDSKAKSTTPLLRHLLLGIKLLLRVRRRLNNDQKLEKRVHCSIILLLDYIINITIFNNRNRTQISKVLTSI